MKNLTTSQKAILWFTILYTLGFSAYYFTSGNLEFIGYVVVMVGVFALLYSTLHITKFPSYIVGGISLWGLLHMMGGSIKTADGVLYAWKIYPFIDMGTRFDGEFYILKYDQFVHGYLYAVVALLFLHLLRNYYGLKKNQFLVGVVAVMASLGVSAMNEIVEFTAVVIDPNNGVGGYYNTALDIVFNFTGAFLATIGFYILQQIKRT